MRIRHYNFITALLLYACGQGEVVMMSGDLTDKDYVVALFHLVQVPRNTTFISVNRG